MGKEVLRFKFMAGFPACPPSPWERSPKKILTPPNCSTKPGPQRPNRSSHLKSPKLELCFLVSVETALVWEQKTKQLDMVKHVPELEMTSYSKNNLWELVKELMNLPLALQTPSSFENHPFKNDLTSSAAPLPPHPAPPCYAPRAGYSLKGRLTLSKQLGTSPSPWFNRFQPWFEVLIAKAIADSSDSVNYS